MATSSGAADGNGNDGDEAGLPAIELLEFLGSFSTGEGEWIDPQSLLEEDIQMLIDMAAGSVAGEEQATRESETETQAVDND